MISTVTAPLNTGIPKSVVVKVVLMHRQTTRHDRILYSISKRKLLLWSAKCGTFLIFCMLPCLYSWLWNYVQWLWQDLLWKPQTHLNFCMDINLTSSLLHECNDYIVICSVLCILQKGSHMLCFEILWELGTQYDVMELNDVRTIQSSLRLNQSC